MGVRGLQTYMEKHCPPRCFRKVSIEELVQQHRQETGEKQPVIIVDGSSCIPFLYEDLDWVAGGQFKEYLKKLEKFVAAFKKAGVRQVYFFEGGKPDNKEPEAKWKTTGKIERVNLLFDALAQGTPVRELSPYLTLIPPANLGFSHYFKELLDVEVRIAARYEAEIVDYAEKNNCLAIFGQDTDFIIYGGAKYNLSAKDFDLETMTTYNYDRNELASYMGLSLTQLPILATLGGNGFADPFELKRFHKSLCKDFRVRFEVLYPALGEYIQQLPSGEALFKALPSIAKEVLNDEEKACILESSISSYFPIPALKSSSESTGYPEWDKICRKAEELHVNDCNTAAILNVLMEKPYRCTITTEDLRNPSLPPSGQLLRPLRQRFYGILLAEKPPKLGSKLYQEWSREDPASLGELYFVKPIVPTDYHPGLLALWSDDRSNDMQNVRWKLFTHAVSSRLEDEEIKDLPDHLILPIPALFYLVEHNAMELWEIEALLATVITLPSEPLEKLAELPSDPVNVQAVQIATIFMRTLATCFKLLNACGFPFPRSKVFQHPYFDGKLFQEKYRKAKDGATDADLCKNQVSEIEIFRKIKLILLKATSRPPSHEQSH